MRVRIVTWNIWDVPFWFSIRRHQRIHQLGAFLKTHNCDIICLQESFDIRHRDLIWRDLGREYFITEGYDRARRVFLFKKFDITGGLVTFSRFPILASSFVPFGGHLRSGIVERVGVKGIIKTVIKLPQTTLLIINTNLFTGQGFIAERFRQKQIVNIMDRLERLRGELPTFLAGDLNANFDKEHHSEALLLRSGFQDAARLLKADLKRLATYLPENKYSNVWFNSTSQPQRLDYIFVRDLELAKIKLLEIRVLEQPIHFPLSDHEPVLLECEIPI